MSERITEADLQKKYTELQKRYEAAVDAANVFLDAARLVAEVRRLRALILGIDSEVASINPLGENREAWRLLSAEARAIRGELDQ